MGRGSTCLVYFRTGQGTLAEVEDALKSTSLAVQHHGDHLAVSYDTGPTLRVYFAKPARSSWMRRRKSVTALNT